jgi:hypothetical protein
MIHRRTIGLGLAIGIGLSTATPAGAQHEDGWTKVMALPAGTRIRITPFDGTRTTGTVDRVGPDYVRIKADAAGAGPAMTSVARPTVRMLEHIGHRSWKGTAIGAGLGALAGVVILLTVEPKDARGPAIRTHHELPVMLASAGIGTGAGVATDLIRRPPVDVVYVAPAPLADPHGNLIESGSEIIRDRNDRGEHGRGTDQPDGVAERYLCQSS